ncbi:MAG: efflux RND transporter periplasmic adaptor subunit [bacterium]|nr:efflux RND transporter periplasmic adaptor subunit [bacterium]
MKAIKVIAVIIVIGLFLWGGYNMFFKEKAKEVTEVIKAEKTDGAKKGKSKEASLPVSVLKVTRGDMPMRLPISATADVWEKATLKAEVSGTVESIPYSVGANIGRGRLVLKLDDTEKKLDLEQADASRLYSLSKYLVNKSIENDSTTSVPLVEGGMEALEKVKAKYLAAKKDYAKGKISQKKLDAISLEYVEAQVIAGVLKDEVRKAEGFSSADAMFKKAKLDLDRTSIKSPFPGIISDIKVSKGQKVSAGTELLKIVNLQSIYLRGYALESEVRHLKAGTPVRIKFDSFPDEYFVGMVKSVSPEVDPANKTITIFVTVKNDENKILPGMHAELDIEYQIHKNVIKVPRMAVLVRQERPLVFKIKDKIAIWEYVEVGPKNDEEQIIISGVSEGDKIVVDGHLTLAHQSKVKIVKTLEQK